MYEKRAENMLVNSMRHGVCTCKSSSICEQVCIFPFSRVKITYLSTTVRGDQNLASSNRPLTSYSHILRPVRSTSKATSFLGCR